MLEPMIDVVVGEVKDTLEGVAEHCKQIVNVYGKWVTPEIKAKEGEEAKIPQPQAHIDVVTLYDGNQVNERRDL